MNMELGVLFSNLVGLFLIIAVGFAAVRLKVLKPEASDPLNRLLMNISLPATLFTSMLREFDPSFLRDGLWVCGLATFMFLFNAAASTLLARLLRIRQGRRGTWAFSCTFCNNGFMGFPITYAVFGADGLALAAMLGIPFNLLIYSLGVWQISQDGTGSGQKTSLRKILITPINISILLGLGFYLLQIPVPEMLRTPLDHLSNITTPLSMFLTGMCLAGGSLVEIFRERDAFSLSIVRLAVLPLAAWAMIRWIPLENPLVSAVTLLILAMPCPAVGTILADIHGGDKELAAKGICLTSLLCIVSLPLFAMLL